MQQSSEAAAGCLRDAGASACTDVTGFGLLGHLVEMARPSQARPPPRGSAASGALHVQRLFRRS